jgi:hypothetical protein
MINSKNLKKLSEKLESLDNIIDMLNSGQGVMIEFGNSSGVHKICLHVSPESKSVYDLSKEISKAFQTFRSHLEREIKREVRP